MSTARWGKKWADVDEDDDDNIEGLSPKSKGARFETPVDDSGVKTVIEYIERDGKTYKVTKHVKVRAVSKWTNTQMEARKTMGKFGKALGADPAEEAIHIKQSTEDVIIEVPRKTASLVTNDDAEYKFFEASIELANQLTKEKKVWTDVNREKQAERETDAAPAPEAPKPSGFSQGAFADIKTAAAPDAAGAGGKGGPAKYVPPSLRGADGKGKGGKGDLQQQQEASLRVTNLSEDVKEGDLQDLFGQCGRLQRVFLAKHMDTGMSKGFAFITYYSRDDAVRAIKKLHGHGYDNLIMQVMFAKPRE